MSGPVRYEDDEYFTEGESLRLLEQSAKDWEVIRNKGKPDPEKECVWNPKPEELK